jgi:hypothetical protein
VANSEVIAYRVLRQVGPSEWLLVVRSRDTLEQLWTAPIERFSVGERGPILISDGRIYLQDSSPSGEVVKAFPVDGCGAATCTPTSTFPIPPGVPNSVTGPSQLLAATDDGDLLLARSWFDNRAGFLGDDLVALTSDGTVDWALDTVRLDGVAVVGDWVYVVGHDAATPSGMGTLFARSDSSSWRADFPNLQDPPIVAGGSVYVATLTIPAGTDVAVFDADGCGAPSCGELTVVDAGSGTGGIYGMSVTAGTLYVNKAGPGGQLIAYRP